MMVHLDLVPQQGQYLRCTGRSEPVDWEERRGRVGLMEQERWEDFVGELLTCEREISEAVTL